MGVIVKRLPVTGARGKRELAVVFDSGAQVSLVRADIGREVSYALPRAEARRFRPADGKTTMMSSESTDLDVAVDGKSIDGQFYLVENLSHEVLVGADFMQKWGVVLYMKEERVEVRLDPQAIQLL